MDPVRIGTGATGRRSQTADRDPNQLSVVIRVNPEKKLPELDDHHSREVQSALPNSETVTERSEVELAFDYPAEGPADIYALGVPRDARVEDRHAAAGPGPNYKDCPAAPA